MPSHNSLTSTDIVRESPFNSCSYLLQQQDPIDKKVISRLFRSLRAETALVPPSFSAVLVRRTSDSTANRIRDDTVTGQEIVPGISSACE